MKITSTTTMTTTIPDPDDFQTAGESSQMDSLRRIFLSGRVPHAFLFTGEGGIGKYFSALKFAALLNSGDCSYGSIRKKIFALQEPWVKLILPLPRGKAETNDDGPLQRLSEKSLNSVIKEIELKKKNPYHKISIEGANVIKISSIRELKKSISIDYGDIAYRVVIIESAHLMTEEAQNALLKSLEEPPQGLVFILLSSDPSRLLPTIRSRCWRIAFNPLPENDLQGVLKEYFKLDSGRAEMLSKISDGSVNTASELLKYDFEELLQKAVFILRYSMAGRFQSVLKEFSDFTKSNGQKKLKLLLSLMEKWFSDCMKDRQGLTDFYFRNQEDTFRKFNRNFPKLQTEGITERISFLGSLIDKNVNLNMIIVNIILEIRSLVIQG